MKTLPKKLVVIFGVLWLIAVIVENFHDPQKPEQKRQNIRTTVVRTSIDPDLIKPYTEVELRSKVKNLSTDESVVYNARKFVIQYPTNKSANNTWQSVRRIRKPRMGQQRFWACMQLADYDYGK